MFGVLIFFLSISYKKGGTIFITKRKEARKFKTKKIIPEAMDMFAKDEEDVLICGIDEGQLP